MGGVISHSRNRPETTGNHFDIHSKYIERFAKSAFLSATDISKLQSFFSSVRASSSFSLYIATNFNDPKLNVDEFIEVVTLIFIVSFLSQTICLQNFKSSVNSKKNCLSHSLSQLDFDTEKYTTQVVAEIDDNGLETELLGIFQGFVTSCQYSAWRALERGECLAYLSQCSRRIKCLEQVTFTHKAFSIISSTVLNHLLSRSMWLAQLVSTAECLPVAFSLAKVSDDLSSFPLVYINPAFCQASMRSKERLIGVEFHMQLSTADEDSTNTSIMMRNLIQARDEACSVTIASPDGKSPKVQRVFRTKCVFDERDRYQYVIGLLIPVGMSDEDISRIEALLEKLPYVV
jgi:hypothetical protein